MRILALLLLLVLPATAQLNISKAPFVAGVLKPSGGGGGSPAADVFTETFNATGYDLGAAPKWYESGTVNEDFSTTGLSMEGAQCLEIDGHTANGETGYFTWGSTTVSNSGYFYFRCTGLPTTLSAIARYKDSFDVLAKLEIFSDGTLYIRNGTGSNPGTTGAMTTNTTYRVWFDYQKGSGANGVATAAFSTTATRPTSGANFVQTTDGTATVNANAFYLYCEKTAGSNQTNYFDNVQIATFTIGDNPP